MNNKTKKAIDQTFTAQYDNLSRIALSFTRDRNNNLLSIVYESLIEQKNLKGVKNAIDNDNLFNYIYGIMYQQVFFKNTKYVREKMKEANYDDYEYFPITEILEEDTEINERKWLKLQEFIYEIHREGFITEYALNLHQLYYNWEEMVDIEGLTAKETKKKRKMTYRELGQSVGIQHVAIYYNIKATNIIIKEELNKRKIKL